MKKPVFQFQHLQPLKSWFKEAKNSWSKNKLDFFMWATIYSQLKLYELKT